MDIFSWCTVCWPPVGSQKSLLVIKRTQDHLHSVHFFVTEIWLLEHMFFKAIL